MTQSDEVGEGGEGDIGNVGRRRWGRSRGPRRGPSDEPLYAGLGTRVEKILRLAEAQAEQMLETARAEAAAIIANAEREAARIRAEAEAEADADAAVRPPS